MSYSQVRKHMKKLRVAFHPDARRSPPELKEYLLSMGYSFTLLGTLLDYLEMDNHGTRPGFEVQWYARWNIVAQSARKSWVSRWNVHGKDLAHQLLPVPSYASHSVRHISQLESRRVDEHCKIGNLVAVAQQSVAGGVVVAAIPPLRPVAPEHWHSVVASRAQDGCLSFRVCDYDYQGRSTEQSWSYASSFITYRDVEKLQGIWIGLFGHCIAEDVAWFLDSYDISTNRFTTPILPALSQRLLQVLHHIERMSPYSNLAPVRI